MSKVTQAESSTILPTDFEDYINSPRVPETTRDFMRSLLVWMCNNHTELDTRIAWNQPMFTHHGTFIVGFSAASKHLCFSSENIVQERLRSAFTDAGYKCLKRTVNFPPSISHFLMACSTKQLLCKWN